MQTTYTPFVRVPGTRQFRLLINGLRQFFTVVHCADGSICEYGPFASGEEAMQCRQDIESPVFYDEYLEE